MKIFNFRSQDVNESLRHIVVTYNNMRFCKENHAVDQGEKIRMIISTEPDSEMKYGKDIDNAYNELVP